MVVFHPRVLNRHLPFAAEVRFAVTFLIFTFSRLLTIFRHNLWMVRHVLQLKLHQEVELPELLRHDDAQVMLLEGCGLFGFIP